MTHPVKNHFRQWCAQIVYTHTNKHKEYTQLLQGGLWVSWEVTGVGAVVGPESKNTLYHAFGSEHNAFVVVKNNNRDFSRSQCLTCNFNVQALIVRRPFMGERAHPGPCIWAGHRFQLNYMRPCVWTSIWPLPLHCRFWDQTFYLTLERSLAAQLEISRGAGRDWHRGVGGGGWGGKWESQREGLHPDHYDRETHSLIMMTAQKIIKNYIIGRFLKFEKKNPNDGTFLF